MIKTGCAVKCQLFWQAIKPLKEDGGSLKLNVNFSWCQSIFRGIGFTKRRTTTARQSVSSGFLKEMRFSFDLAIKEVVDAYDIPDDLMININPTPPPFILLSKCTMDKKNEKLVPVTNSADYRQVTGTFSQLPIKK